MLVDDVNGRRVKEKNSENMFLSRVFKTVITKMRQCAI